MWAVVVKLARLWAKLGPDVQRALVELVEGASSGDFQVKRAHEEALRRAVFEARQRAKLG